MRRPYKEGDWFGVPLQDGGYGVGLIARAGKRGRILFGYFFGPRRTEVPNISELTDLTPQQSILSCQFGDLGLVENEWPIIGRLTHWNREDWPMPRFANGTGPGGKVCIVTYSDTDPGKTVFEEFVDPEVAAGFPKDTLSGAGAVEIKLTHLLSNG